MVAHRAAKAGHGRALQSAAEAEHGMVGQRIAKAERGMARQRTAKAAQRRSKPFNRGENLCIKSN